MKKETEIVHNSSQLALGETILDILLSLPYKHMMNRCLISPHQLEVAWECMGYNIGALFDFTTKAIDITCYLPDKSGASRSASTRVVFVESDVSIPEALSEQVRTLEQYYQRSST